MKFQYIPINSIFSKLIRDVTDLFNEDDIVEWCGEALEFIGAVTLYEEAVAFIEISNHQGKLPLGLHKIIQVARNNNYNAYKNCTPLDICQNEPELSGLSIGDNPCNCNSEPVWLDANGQPIVAYDVAYYRPYFDLKAEFEGWSNSRYYKKNFSPVRLANSTLFNTLVSPEGSGYEQTVDSYNIILGNIIRTSFKEGQICVPCYRQVRDKETGYPMIPDDISFKTAITKYIQYKIADKEFQSGRDGADRRLQKYESDWQWYCSQSSDKAMMPSGVDEYQNLLDQRTTLIPNHTKYYGFFGNLSKPENGYPNYRRGEPNIGETIPYFKNDNMSCNTPTQNIGFSNNVTRIPPIVTINGTQLIITNNSSYKWIDTKYKGYKLEVFANSFNRYLVAGEYVELVDGGIEIFIGGPYGINDIFKIIPNGIK